MNLLPVIPNGLRTVSTRGRLRLRGAGTVTMSQKGCDSNQLKSAAMFGALAPDAYGTRQVGHPRTRLWRFGVYHQLSGHHEENMDLAWPLSCCEILSNTLRLCWYGISSFQEYGSWTRWSPGLSLFLLEIYSLTLNNPRC